MTSDTTTPSAVLNPEDIEAKIDEITNRIANGVQVVTAAERKAKEARRNFDLAFAKASLNAEGSIPDKKHHATVDTMELRQAAEVAEIAFRLAERTADALEKSLLAQQSILKSVVAMYGAVKA